MFATACLLNIVLEILVSAVRQEKFYESINTGKETKLSLSTDAMIICKENPKENTNKLLELVRV